MPGDGKSSEEWSSTDKFRVVLEVAGLSEVELAEYCRRKGLYVEQVQAWRAACEQANATAEEQGRVARVQDKAARQRIKSLEREVTRKNAALAEAAALLVLQKKCRRSGTRTRTADSCRGARGGPGPDRRGGYCGSPTRSGLRSGGPELAHMAAMAALSGGGAFQDSCRDYFSRG